MHKRLRRLERVWIDSPIYFITTCTAQRSPLLANAQSADILVTEWREAQARHGWMIGDYMIMPDHVHFFCAATRQTRTLSMFMKRWKEWTSKKLAHQRDVRTSLWQEGFFDHVLR